MEPFKFFDDNDADSGESTPHIQTPSLGRRTKPRSGGLLQKLFSRRSSDADETGNDEQVDDNCDVFHSLSIGPNPSIRPLGQKLVARSEKSLSSSPRVLTRPESALSRARKLGETCAATRDASLGSTLTPNSPQIDEDIESDFSPTDDAADVSSLEECLTDRISSVCESVAGDAALNRHHFRDWVSYLTSYAEGHYNISSPPPPPPRDSGFSFLPAIYPSNEGIRLAALDRWNVNWGDCVSQRAREICSEAMSRFEVKMVAISMFDRGHEVLIAESGWGREKIQRWESMAGHVLLSSEVLSVLDARKDWRFAGNPFVTGTPNIRFFAGAPMMAPDGEVLGVFSIFSTEARSEYTPFQRRDLCDFAITAMSELTSLKGYIPDSERETPILQREDLINGTATYGDSISPATRRLRNQPSLFDPNLIPPALNYRKPSSTNSASPNESLNSNGENWNQLRRETPQDTPPHFGDFDGSVFRDEERSRTLKQLTIKEAVRCVAVGGNLTPDSNSYDDFSLDEDLHNGNMFDRPGTPTPASRHGIILPTTLHDSTATTIVCSPESMFDDGESVGIPRPESPVIPSADQDLDEPSLSFNSTTGIFTDGTFTEIQNTLAIARNNIDNAQQSHEHALHTRASLATLSTLSTDISEGDLVNTDPRAEAVFAAEFWAQNLCYDVIYAVQLIPAREFMTDAELSEPGALRMRTLVSVGLDGDIDFDVTIHLETLRSSGAIVWGCNQKDPGEFGRGILMALAHDQAPQQQRSHGIVFGAFKKFPQPGEVPNNFSTKEYEKLQEAAGVLRQILMKPVPHRRPKRSNTDPCPPSQFLADEATPMKYSLDAGIRRLEDHTNMLQVRVAEQSN